MLTCIPDASADIADAIEAATGLFAALTDEAREFAYATGARTLSFEVAKCSPGRTRRV